MNGGETEPVGSGPHAGSEMPAGGGRHSNLESPRPGVSPWWRVASIVLTVLVVILFVALTVFAPLSETTLTKVDWFRYEVTAGPGIDSNSTTLHGIPFMCAPSNATTVAVFSMVWSTSNGRPVELVRIWTLENLTTTPEGVTVNLYLGFNASSGGTSILATYPTPCWGVWVLAVSSNATVTVTAIATLTYNYTASAPIL